MKRTLCFLWALMTLSFGSLQAQNCWSDANESYLKIAAAQRQVVPTSYRLVSMDVQRLQAQLQLAPMEFSAQAITSPVIVALPMPDGKTMSFKVVNSPVMERELSDKYPMLHTYSGIGIEDPSATARLDITPNGLNVIVMSEKQQSVFISPYAKGNAQFHTVYYKKNLETDLTGVSCGTENDPHLENLLETAEKAAGARAGDGKLRNYRLALGCTGEYGQYHGGTKTSVLAAFTTAVNQLNAIFAREASVKLIMIGNTDKLIFTSSLGDPYTSNSTYTMLDEHQQQCDLQIGTSGYDIGHLFSMAGGVAQLQSPCNNSGKARANSGHPSKPVGPGFIVDIVAHEMGHQFGCTHSYNNNCSGNISTGTAYEVMSGATIMSYAGVCPPNMQNYSEPYYHGANITQFVTFITTGGGKTCALSTATGNTPPVANAGQDRTVPKSSSLELPGVGTDVNGDTLAYTWDQMDLALNGDKAPTSTSPGPLFQFRAPSLNPSRYLPNINALVNNTNAQYEVLPTIARNLNFRLTVRDIRNGFGASDKDDLKLTVDPNSGPFLMTKPNGGGKWYIADNETVTWDVANTDKAPVDATNVDISLSLDGGFTYPIMLAAGVPNTGTATVKVPNVMTTKARVKVRGSGNYFIDISNANFTIENPPTPTFIMAASPTNFAGCNLDSAIFYIKLTAISNYSTPVNLSATNVPIGAKVVFGKNPAAPSDSVRVVVKDLKNVLTGSYTFNVLTTSGIVSNTTSVGLQLVNGTPPVTTGVSPSNYATNVPADVRLFWNKKTNTTQYVVDVSTSPVFSPLLETATVTDTFFKTTKLQVATVYYWRVKTRNPCADAAYSPTLVFQTTREGCTEYKNSGLTIAIPDNEVDTMTNKLTIPGNFTISDINVYASVQHEFVGDLSVWVESPDKTRVLLMRDSCLSSQDIRATFDDEGYKFNCAFFPAVGGVIKPAEGVLSAFDGKNSQGDWKIKIFDSAAPYPGVFQEWRVNVCGIAGSNDLNITNIALGLTEKQTVTVSKLNLSAISTGSTDAQMLFTLMIVPAQGKLKLNGVDLKVGDTFTQDDINQNKLTYVNSTANPTKDTFVFNVQANGGAWIGGTTFTFNLTATSAPLIATAVLTKNAGCFGSSNGTITVTASGGTPPYQYSSDGVIFQSSNVLGGLKAGTYTPKVKDAGGQVLFTNSVVVTQPAVLLATATLSGNVVTGSVTGGTGPTFGYIWSTGSPTTSITVSGPGTYCFTVTDSNGCSNSSCASVIAPLTATGSVTKPISCVGDANATITIKETGGVAPFQYQLGTGTFQSTGVFINLAAGTYTGTVKDATGNTKTTANIIVNPPVAVVASGVVSGMSITASATGGTPPYQYNIDGGAYQNSKNFTNLPNKTYTVGVKDGNGCLATASVVVNFTVLSATATVKSPLCNGDKNGVITAVATGGVAPYQYKLDAGAYQTSGVFTGVGTGSNTVTAKDAQGTTFPVTVAVAEPTKLTLTATIVQSELTAVATGGTAPYTYKVVGATTVLQATPVFTKLPNGSYTLTVTDANGCVTTLTSIVNGIFDIVDNLSFNVSPNPNQGSFVLTLQQPLIENAVTRLFDISGKLIMTKEMNVAETQQQIEVANLPNGTYTLQIKSGKYVGHKKVVIMR
jgi:subtilisin-like proprotein convertase family protein